MVLSYEQKDAVTGQVIIVNITVPDPTAADIAAAQLQAQSEQKRALLNQINDQSVIQIINGMDKNGTIKIKDLPQPLQDLITAYNNNPAPAPAPQR